jgi:acyl-homoserine lactone acylase PvdQ
VRSKLTRAGMALVLVTTSLVLAPATPAVAASAYLAPNDFCLEQCDDILPPGQNGNATLAEILAAQAFGLKPKHNDDQIGKYANLLSAYTGLTNDQIGQFYNSASYGVPASQVESTIYPRGDVRIVRDKATGVPHIYGTTRGGTMFGAGFAGANDRLFLMDLLRHVGRGKLTSFAGGSPGNQALEQQVWRNSPYTEADLQAQVQFLRDSGPRGALLYSDITEFVAGINAYIAQCMAARPVNCPGEYVLTGNLDAITNEGGPQPFQLTDVVAISGVVGGLFGGGGGSEMRSALVRVEAQAKYGQVAGDQVWKAFREQNDPETVLTLHNGQSFPYGQTPANASGVVLPDRGTASPTPVVFNRTGSASASATGKSVLPVSIGDKHQGMSNAIVVSGAHTTTGNPIAVFGPQTAYFSPQLLMLQELQGPGISARGASFAGVNLYVQLGRGQDYAWSATSASQDITDTYSVPLCGDINSNSYLFNGTCTPMDELRQDNSWEPTLADGTPAGSYSLITYRTKYGLVLWRGMVNGVPTAFTSLRSTYRHEADSAIGFQMFNDPSLMGDASAFMNSASNIGYAFNWFYVNSTQAAYFNSGSNPVRPAHVDPNLPIAATPANHWVGWNPENNTAQYTPAAAHPQSVNQDFYISWNNKQAKDFSASDGNFSFGPVHRGDMLDRGVRAAIANGQKVDRAAVIKIAEAAAHEDLRATELLPLLLQVLTSQPVTDPAQATVVAQLQAWLAAGGRRTETSPGSHVYQHADAIRVFDAWWPRLVEGQFKPALGSELFSALVSAIQIDEPPSDRDQPHKGSAFQYGWWGYVDKDLRAVLGQPVQSPLAATYCGGGTLAGCRSVLLGTLSAAAAVPVATVYPGDGDCAAGDQWCADTVIHSALGGIEQDKIGWQNRPTYQQVAQFPARRGDNIANLAHGKAASASSTQFLTSNTPAKAVDANDSSRWASSWSDNQWIRVDLGSAQTVSRVILHWESAYARGYRIEVSNNGSQWTSVFATSAGNGGTDNVSFAPVSARYVRMYGVSRATSYGFSLYEFDIYAK